MFTKTHIVILTAMSLTMAAGCEPSDSKDEPGPLERAAQKEPVLTTTVVEPIAIEAPKPSVHDKVEPPSKAEKSEALAPEVSEPIYEPTLEGEGGLTIKRLITAGGVEGREPVAQTSVFGDQPGKVYAFLEASNEDLEPKALKVFFIAPSGKATGGVELTIPAESPRWRTWAFTRFADEVGLWRVEVRSPSGALLAALPFEVSEGC